MFTQPSVNQIASTYQGRPAPLARKVDQDKKQNGGIPKDLRQLMALNDIAEGKQAVGINQALQIPTNMPTVAQATQQQAQQAIQARMMQMAREQQRLQQKPPVLPPGTPQPEEQPQGIDALATNVGDAYAEGGIIGFDGTKSSFVKDLGSFAEKLKGAFTETEEEKAARKLQQQIQQEGAPIGYFTKGSEDYDKKSALRTFIGDNPTVVKNPAFQADPVAFMEKTKNVNTAQDVNVGKSTYVPNAQADAMETNKLFNLAATPSAEAVKPTQVNAPRPTANTGIAGAQGAAGGPKAPSVQAALEKAGIINLPVDDKAQKRMTEIMNMDPAAEERLAQAKFKQQVGDRDLSIYDRTAAELQARKEKLNGPKPGFEGLMDYLDNIAEAGGKDWQTAGSRGASLQKQKRLAREAQQNELMDKILELGAKKTEAEYGQKLNMYQIGQKRYEDVFKNVMDATKDMRMSETERMKMAQQAVIAQMDNDAKLRAAQIGAGGRDDLAARAAAIRAENKGMSVEESIKRAAMATYAGQTAIAEGKNTAATEKAIDAIRAGYAKTMKFLSPDSPLYKRQQTMMEQDIAEARRKDMGSGLPDAVPAKKPEGVTVTKIGS